MVTNNSEAVSRFLDSDKRPLAIPVSKSTAGFTVVQFEAGSYYSNILFEGSLGAIVSDQDPKKYVGFTGVEVKAEIVGNKVCRGPRCNKSDFEFNIDLKLVGDKILTIELVVDQMGKEETYSYDVPVKSGVNSFVNRSALILTEFQQTFRGSKLNKFYDNKDRVVAYRFFFKRSLNEPFQTSAIPIRFHLSTEMKRTDSESIEKEMNQNKLVKYGHNRKKRFLFFSVKRFVKRFIFSLIKFENRSMK